MSMLSMQTGPNLQSLVACADEGFGEDGSCTGLSFSAVFRSGKSSASPGVSRCPADVGRLSGVRERESEVRLGLARLWEKSFVRGVER